MSYYTCPDKILSKSKPNIQNDDEDVDWEDMVPSTLLEIKNGKIQQELRSVDSGLWLVNQDENTPDNVQRFTPKIEVKKETPEVVNVHTTSNIINIPPPPCEQPNYYVLPYTLAVGDSLNTNYVYIANTPLISNYNYPTSNTMSEPEEDLQFTSNSVQVQTEDDEFCEEVREDDEYCEEEREDDEYCEEEREDDEYCEEGREDVYCEEENEVIEIPDDEGDDEEGQEYILGDSPQYTLIS